MRAEFILAGMIARSHWTSRLSRRGVIETDFGSTHLHRPPEESLAYIDACFDDYLTYGGLARDGLAGWSILEAGPGDNFGVAARMIAAGAHSYTGVDAFRSQQNPARQRRIYELLRERLDAAERQRFDRAITLGEKVVFNPDRLRPIYGRSIAGIGRLFPPDSFDLIVSRAVLEEVSDIEGALGAMDFVLKPGGWLLHKIDLSDYGIFSGRGLHPLTHLTFSDRLYGLLAPDTGNLNRYTIADYRQYLAKRNYQARLYVTGAIRRGYPQRDLTPHPLELRLHEHYGDEEIALVKAIRPRLAGRYRAMADEDLIAAGVFLAARKPPAH